MLHPQHFSPILFGYFSGELRSCYFLKKLYNDVDLGRVGTHVSTGGDGRPQCREDGELLSGRKGNRSVCSASRCRMKELSSVRRTAVI